jgi:hypothetical protein
MNLLQKQTVIGASNSATTRATSLCCCQPLIVSRWPSSARLFLLLLASSFFFLIFFLGLLLNLPFYILVQLHSQAPQRACVQLRLPSTLHTGIFII